MAGVIDPDYRGDVTILLHNFGDKHQQIKPGERITQLILERAEMVETVVVNELNPTERNTSGFGVQKQRVIVHQRYIRRLTHRFYRRRHRQNCQQSSINYH